MGTDEAALIKKELPGSHSYCTHVTAEPICCAVCFFYGLFQRLFAVSRNCILLQFLFQFSVHHFPPPFM